PPSPPPHSSLCCAELELDCRGKARAGGASICDDAQMLGRGKSSTPVAALGLLQWPVADRSSIDSED
ncbi:unnamed protein product, partial [Urochloa humidicola]